MKIAMIGDLHGNLPATEKLDEDLKRRGIKHIYCLGDMVGKGPSSSDTFDWAVKNCEVIIRGNWDEGISFKQFQRDEFYYQQLGEKRMKMLGEFPLEHHMILSGRKIRLFHGRPIMDHLIQLQDDESIWKPFFQPDFEVVGYADIHRQGVRMLNSGVLFNTGSVGNGLGVPMVQYAIMEGSDKKGDPLDITMITLPYDQERAARDAEEAGKKGLVNADAFMKEVRTGIYSR